MENKNDLTIEEITNVARRLHNLLEMTKFTSVIILSDNEGYEAMIQGEASSIQKSLISLLKKIEND